MSKIEDKIFTDLELIGTHPSGNSDLDIVTIEYDPTGQPNSQNAIDRAQRENLIVVFPKDNQLFIDLDNEHSYLLFKKQWDIFKKYVDLEATFGELPSKSGLPKRHITINLSYFINELERLAFQAMLGSDRVRELLGYVQMKNGDPHPTLFLEAKPKGAVFEDGDILTDEDCPF